MPRYIVEVVRLSRLRLEAADAKEAEAKAQSAKSAWDAQTIAVAFNVAPDRKTN